MLVFSLTSLFESEWEGVFYDEIREGEFNNFFGIQHGLSLQF